MHLQKPVFHMQCNEWVMFSVWEIRCAGVILTSPSTLTPWQEYACNDHTYYLSIALVASVASIALFHRYCIALWQYIQFTISYWPQSNFLVSFCISDSGEIRPKSKECLGVEKLQQQRLSVGELLEWEELGGTLVWYVLPALDVICGMTTFLRRKRRS